MIGIILAIAILGYFINSCVHNENNFSTCKIWLNGRALIPKVIVNRIVYPTELIWTDCRVNPESGWYWQRLFWVSAFFWCARHGVWRCLPRQLKALLKTTDRRLQYMQLLSDDSQVSDQSVSAYSTHRGSGWVSHRWISVRSSWKGWGCPRPRRIVASTA